MFPEMIGLHAFGCISQTSDLTMNYEASQWKEVANSWGLIDYLPEDIDIRSTNEPARSWPEIMDKVLNEHREAWEILSNL